jgi:hypothetical protein
LGSNSGFSFHPKPSFPKPLRRKFRKFQTVKAFT